MKITITKTKEETSYTKVVKMFTFDVNGKKIRIESWTLDDPETDNYDSGEEIIEDAEYEKLNDEEQEALGENLNELFDLTEPLTVDNNS